MRSFFCYICRMKSKLHFGILIILFAFLGRYIDTSVAPNQQIIIEFSDEQITESETQRAIEAIQVMLITAGANQIKVGQNDSGQLKITYFSNTHVEQIKNLLSKQDYTFAYSANEDQEGPLDNTSRDYQLNISEIQKSSNASNWDFEGVQVLEFNQKSDRFNNLKVNNSLHQIDTELTNLWTKVALRFSINNTLLINNHSYKIPEVRAGPII